MKSLRPLTLHGPAGRFFAPETNGSAPAKSRRGFTLVEAMVSLAILAIFGLVSTATLNLFDDRAARNRNAEAARAVVDDYVNYLLNDNTPAPTATAAGTDLDGDGNPDGVVCTAISTRAIPNATLANGIIPLIVTRTATLTATAPPAVVSGTLYWRVQGVGTSFGLAADTDLMQVNFLLVYTYRNQTFYYKATTFKANT